MTCGKYLLVMTRTFRVFTSSVCMCVVLFFSVCLFYFLFFFWAAVLCLSYLVCISSISSKYSKSAFYILFEFQLVSYNG